MSLLNYFPKLSQLTNEEKTALAAQLAEQRDKEIAESRQRQREQVQRKVTAEALALQERSLQRARGPGRPRKTALSNVHINVNTVNVNCGTFIAGSGSVINDAARESPPSVSPPSSSAITSSSSSSSSSTSSSPSSSFSSAPAPDTSSSSSPQSLCSPVASLPLSTSSSAPLFGPAHAAQFEGALKKRGTDGYVHWNEMPEVFEMIIKAVEGCRDWNDALQSLQKPSNPVILQRLRVPTMKGWFDSNFKLLPHIRQRWEERLQRLGGIGHRYSLADHADLERHLVSIFAKRRESGLVVNSNVAVPIMRAVIQQRAPHLLDKMALSRRWVRQWLRSRCGFTYKRATTSGQKLPADWEEKVETMIDRAAAVVVKYKIAHPSLVINWDQSAIMLVPTSKYTYHSKKDKHVSVTGQDDKRQITTVVGGTLEGELLPLQMIFAGQEKNRKQHKAVPVMDDDTALRVKAAGWHLTQTPNHWSSQLSMVDYVDRIITPWVTAKRQQHKCPGSHVLLLFDCWSVHKSEEFLGWMKEHHPDFHIVFIPACCTGKAQPADVVMQRPLKCEITNQFLQWTTEIMTAQLRPDSSDVPDFEINTAMGTLKPRLVTWTFEAWSRLRERKAMILKGWSNIGLDAIFKPERQQAALLRLLTKGINVDTVDSNGEELDIASGADLLERQAEDEECEAGDEVEEDEEEVDIDVSIAACLEGREITQGVRRSNRLRDRDAVMQDARLAQLLQESVYDRRL